MAGQIVAFVPQAMEESGTVSRKRARIHHKGLGVRCHWCRQKTIEDHVKCTYCIYKFCGRCLLNRHGEDIKLEIAEHVKWVCPKCRPGCGPGCLHNCCNCVPCRRLKNMEPAGSVIVTARANGFNNAHDYLIHLQTGESADVIARRKEGQGWTSMGHPVMLAIEGPHVETSTDLPVKASTDRSVLTHAMLAIEGPHVETPIGLPVKASTDPSVLTHVMLAIEGPPVETSKDLPVEASTDPDPPTVIECLKWGVTKLRTEPRFMMRNTMWGNSQAKKNVPIYEQYLLLAGSAFTMNIGQKSRTKSKHHKFNDKKFQAAFPQPNYMSNGAYLPN